MKNLTNYTIAAILLVTAIYIFTLSFDAIGLYKAQYFIGSGMALITSFGFAGYSHAVK